MNKKLPKEYYEARIKELKNTNVFFLSAMLIMLYVLHISDATKNVSLPLYWIMNALWMILIFGAGIKFITSVNETRRIEKEFKLNLPLP